MIFIDIVLPVFLIILTGFLLAKFGSFDMRTLADIALLIFTPALVFTALLKTPGTLTMSHQLVPFMIIYTLTMWTLAVVCGRSCGLGNDDRRALILSTAMMNVGNFGLPLAWFAFGEKGLNISILTFVLFNLPLGTLAIYIAQGGKGDWRTSLLNITKIPIFHAVLLALLCIKMELMPPAYILRPLELLGQPAIPLMLILLGMQLAKTNPRVNCRFLSLAVVLRLCLAPLLAWGLTGLLDITGIARAVVILQTSTPSAVLPLLYSIRFNTRPDLVAGAIFITTLLSSVTLTFILYLLQ
ncbi:MAG: AEC family transporter [Desulfuromonadaceae bacterium]|nr:AEC family transporter [Desulfuromonadaceae bacterium]